MDRPLTLALEEKKIAGFDFTTSRYRPTPRRRSEFHIDATLSGSLTASVYGLGRNVTRANLSSVVSSTEKSFHVPSWLIRVRLRDTGRAKSLRKGEKGGRGREQRARGEAREPDGLERECALFFGQRGPSRSDLRRIDRSISKLRRLPRQIFPSSYGSNYVRRDLASRVYVSPFSSAKARRPRSLGFQQRT